LRKKGLLLHRNMRLDRAFSVVQMPLTLDDYVDQILKSEEYTFLLHDGSSIQVGYRFDRQGQITSHKLAFFLSPLSLPPLQAWFLEIKREYDVNSKDDLIEVMGSFPEYIPKHIEATVSKHDTTAWQDLTWVHWLRLDYNSTEQNLGNHPQSHATIYDDGCRIAVSHYFDLRRFFLLIFAQLWPFRDNGLITAIRQRIPSRIPSPPRIPNLIPSDYPRDYGVFFSF